MTALDVHVRSCSADEFERFYEVLHHSFGVDVPAEEVERARRILPPDRALAAFDGDALVGTTGSFPFTLTVPGGEVSAGGVTMAGVLPSHRRRGVLTRLMRAQLDDASRRGEPVAVLWASESSIYGHFGYGIATFAAEIDIERDRTGLLGEPTSGRVTLLSVPEAVKLLPDVYERVRARTPGMYARAAEWWEAHTLADPKEDRDGGGPRFIAAWETEGRVEAYALYRMHHDWADGMPSGWLEIDEVIGTSPDALREMWRFVFGVDLVARVRSWKQPAVNPLLFMLAEPRRLRLQLKDGVWLRVVDVRPALEARTYPTDGSLVLDVSDHFRPNNAGRWRLEVTDGRARVAKTTEPPDLGFGIAELGSVYLGGVGMGELLTAGRVVEHEPGAAAAATALFASENAPWCPEIF